MRRFQRLMVGAVLSGAVWLAGPARGQGPVSVGAIETAPQPAPRKCYIKSRNFQLPASTENLDKTAVRELRLYCKSGTGDWALQTSAPPTQATLTCSVPQDGEYLFTIVAVDHRGKMPDLNQARGNSSLLVIVDTRPPEVSVQALPSAGDRAMLRCVIRDENPDYRSLILEYPAGNNGWQVLAPLPDRQGVFAFPAGQPLPRQVRLIASDLAGNTATRTVQLSEPTNGTPVTIAEVPPIAPPAGPTQGEVVEARAGQVPAPPESPEGTATPADGGTIGDIPRQFTNRTHIALKYQIEELGPSGIGKMEAWMTRDNGHSWQYLADDPDRQSPIELDLPGEGVYGLSLVVRNGIGFGGRPPAPGEAPQFYVEVDTTRPTAQLIAVRPVGGSNGPMLQIDWTCGDKNLGEEPVELFYAPNRDGPWTPVGPRLKNQGKYHWPLPAAGLGPQVYVRMVVTDQAGNVGQCETEQPVALDLVLPKVRVLGLEGPPPATTGSAN